MRSYSRSGLLRYKIAPKCLLPGPFGHFGVGGNPGVAGTVRSYNLVFTYPCQRGGTTGLLEYQGSGPSLTEGRRPSSDGVRVPFQRRRRGLCPPALGQQQDGVPPLPLPWRRRKSLTSICHCSKDRSISLTLIIYPPNYCTLWPSSSTNLSHFSAYFTLALFRPVEVF